MIFLSNSQGVIVASSPGTLHQGSIAANEIILLAPFPAYATVQASFRLPGGLLTYPRLLAVGDTEGTQEEYPYNLALEEAFNDKLPDGFNVWKMTMDKALTERAGTLGISFIITTPEWRITTDEATTNIIKGGAYISPDVTMDDTATIEALVSAAQQAQQMVAALNIQSGSGTGSVQRLETSTSNKTFDNPNAAGLIPNPDDPEGTAIPSNKIPHGAFGERSDSFGVSRAQGARAHSEGTRTVAFGNYSHAEGDRAISKGEASHAEGKQTQANGKYSHAEGMSTVSGNDYAHAEGYLTSALGPYAHAEGRENTASAEGSHAEGRGNTASGSYSHAEGQGNKGIGWNSHIEGEQNEGSGRGCHLEGRSNLTDGEFTHVEGYDNEAYADHCHVEGSNNKVNSYDAESEYSKNCHVEGNDNKVENAMAATHVEGSHNIADETTDGTHIEGVSNIVTNSRGVHIEGNDNRATNATFSHIEGQKNVTKHTRTHVGGLGNRTSAENQYVIGTYNADDPDALFIVGNGTSESDRSNAFVVKKNGTVDNGGQAERKLYRHVTTLVYRGMTSLFEDECVIRLKSVTYSTSRAPIDINFIDEDFLDTIRMPAFINHIDGDEYYIIDGVFLNTNSITISVMKHDNNSFYSWDGVKLSLSALTISDKVTEV